MLAITQKLSAKDAHSHERRCKASALSAKSDDAKDMPSREIQMMLRIRASNEIQMVLKDMHRVKGI